MHPIIHISPGELLTTSIVLLAFLAGYLGHVPRKNAPGPSSETKVLNSCTGPTHKKRWILGSWWHAPRYRNPVAKSCSLSWRHCRCFSLPGCTRLRGP